MRSSSAAPGHARALGIGTVYQEVNLVPTMSVTKNLTLGRQPRRFGLISWREARARAPGRAAAARASTSTSSGRSAPIRWRSSSSSRSPARSRTTRGCWCSTSRPRASTRNETELLFRILRDLKSARHRHRLHHPFHRPGLSRSPTASRSCATAGWSASAATAELPPLKLISLMLGRELEHAEERLATRRPRDERRADPRGRRAWAAARRWRRSTCRSAAGEVVGLAGLLGSGRTEVAKLIFGAIRPDSGRLDVGGAADDDAARRGSRCATASASARRTARPKASSPNSRVRENIVLALQTKRGWLRRLSLSEQERLAQEMIKTLAIATSGRGQAGRPAVGRQPAEGHARALRWCPDRAF